MAGRTWRWAVLGWLVVALAAAALEPRSVTPLPVRLAAGEGELRVELPALPVGLYSFYLHGRIEAAGREALPRVWRPCPMQFQAVNAAGERVAAGRLLLKQGLTTRRMQGFHLHVDVPGDHVVTFRLLPGAQEVAIVERLEFVDQLADLPAVAVKRSQNLTPLAHTRLPELTADRAARDRLIWDALPPLNVHLQVHQQVAQFTRPPAGVALPEWRFAAWTGGRAHDEGRLLFTPLDIVNTTTGERLTHAQVLAGEPLPDARWRDDGTGLFFAQRDYPDLPHDIYLSPWANLMGRRVQLFVGYLGAWDHNGLSFITAYRQRPDPELAHDAAIALLRIAYDWPALEMNLHELRLCTHTGDLEYRADWSLPERRNGKYFYSGWSGPMAINFMEAYDALFPYLQDNLVLAAAVHRLVPSLNTPEDVIGFLDQRLVFATVRDYRRNIIRGETVEDVAGEVLGPHELTADFFDLTRQHATIYPFTGTYQELHATALNRSGHYHIGSLGYALGDAANLLRKALAAKRAREAGLPARMDLADAQSFPRVRGAADFLVDAWLGGGFWLAIGDTSGGSHAGPVAMERLRMHQAASAAAVELLDDPRHAWLLVNLHGRQEPRLVELAATVPRDPVRHNVSRVLPSWAGIVETNPESADVLEKTAAMLSISSGQGHAHHDQLDLNLYALGLPVAVDLAQRNEGNHWTRPSATWSFLHNHAIAHQGEDPRDAGSQSGEPWLHAFAPPLMRGRYVNARGTERLDRDVYLMQVGETALYYAFDVQQLTGGPLRTWCFHGLESDELELNVPLRPEVVRWTDRALPEKGGRELPPSQRVGTANDTLQAVWTATREPREYPHNFMDGGVVRTVALEPRVLGDRYDAALPPVRLRATLLGHAGATVLVAKPFSEPYGYAFPFLWVQHPATAEPSLYPAVYEWYRGDAPTIATTRLVSRAPLVVEVVTASGQTDTYQLAGETFSVVSHDAQGLRRAHLSGGRELVAAGLRLTAEHAGYATPIVTVDYAARRFATADPLPALTGATIGNDGHRTWVALSGAGRDFAWQHDLQAHEGRVTTAAPLTDELLRLETNQRLFQAGHGNRQLPGFVVTTEDHAWQFRATADEHQYRVIARPAGAPLTAEVFTDANGDGLHHAKTYELGLGDVVALPAQVLVRRTAAGGYEVYTNVPVQVELGPRQAHLQPALTWQPVQP